ncbi:hypothetical protein FRC07_004736 [Ceratobasidium sp. 392]|nr:hypothetical protein FRC07_004736 [Ceratobasidium sp. 392]
MPKLFIDNLGTEDTQYAFVDASGKTQFSSVCTSHDIDGGISTDIYQHESADSSESPKHLVATIKWSPNAFRDPVLVLHSEDQPQKMTKLQLTTHIIRQSLSMVTKGRSRAHWRRIHESGKLVLFTGHNREKRLIADECQHAGKRWLQIETKPVHHCSITDTEIVASWIAMNKFTMILPVNNAKPRRFAVVGAGASGLAILRVFADELKQDLASGNCEIVCFEKRNDSGGIWLPGEPNPPLSKVPATPLYDSLTTNLPLPIMAFLSQHFAPSTWLFPSHQEVNKYLHDYEKRFNLRRFVTFDTLISRAFWDERTSKWQLTLQRNSQPENQSVESFDHLLIGNGHYAKPYSPNFEGLDLWAAHESRRVTHSMWYREPSSYQDLRVLVIGGGPSGNDISDDISEVAKETIQSVRSFQDGQVGRITRRGAIERFAADGLVVFKSGKQAYIDRVILATGYKYDFPFLSQLPLRDPEPNSPTLYNSGSHIYPLAQHLFPLMAPFPPTSAAFFGLTSKVAPFPLFEVQAALAVRVMTGRVDMDFNQEYQLTLARNKKLLEALGAERAARLWHVLDTSESQFGYREILWRLAGELDKTVPAWTIEFYDKKSVIRDEWRDLVKRGEADSWARSIEKGTIDEWLDLTYRVLRQAESKA